MTIYVCSPYRAKTDEQFKRQLEYTKAIAKECVLAGHSVIVPHLYYTRFLDDEVQEERELGIASAIGLLDACDLMLINTRYGISEGMMQEIRHADDMAAIYNVDEMQISGILFMQKTGWSWILETIGILELYKDT